MPKRELKKILPKRPDWRYQLLIGNEEREFQELALFIEEDSYDPDLSRSEDPLYEDALYIYQTPPMKALVEKLLLEKCNHQILCDILEHKFGEAYDKKMVNIYRHFFFDNITFNMYDLAQMLDDMPDAPPVPGSMRSDYIAFKNDGEPNLNADAALKHMFSLAFFRAQELSKFGWATDDKVIKYQNHAVSLYRTMQDYNTDSELPEEFNYEVEYPDETAVDLSEINYEE